MTSGQVRYINTTAKLYNHNIRFALRVLPHCKTPETRHKHISAVTVQQINIIKHDIINDTQDGVSDNSAWYLSLYMNSFGPRCNDLARDLMQCIQMM